MKGGLTVRRTVNRNKREMTPEEQQYWRFRNLNAVIGGFGCLGMVLGGFLLFCTFGILAKLWLPAVIVCWGIIPSLCRRVRKTGKHRRLLNLMRAVGISLLAVIVLAPVVNLGFSRTPLLYPAKRLVFTQGVRNPKIARVILPYLLPRHHADYYFRTDSALHGPDSFVYTAGAYLFLHTDEKTLRRCEASLQDCEQLERLENSAYPAETSAENESLQYRYLPRFVYARMTGRAGMTDDLSHAVVYLADTGSSGVLINYETGLLIVWL